MRVDISPRVFDAALNGHVFGDEGEFPAPRLRKVGHRHLVTYGHLDDIQIGDLLTFMRDVADGLDDTDAPAAADVRSEVDRIHREREALGIPWYAPRKVED
jgi:hypothetical protein